MGYHKKPGAGRKPNQRPEEAEQEAERNKAMTEACQVATRILWIPEETEEQFVARHADYVTRTLQRNYTMGDRIAAAQVFRAISGGSSGAAAMKDLMDRLDGPVIRKEKVAAEKKQNYVIAVPSPPKTPAGADPEEVWKKTLEAHGIVADVRK